MRTIIVLLLTSVITLFGCKFDFDGKEGAASKKLEERCISLTNKYVGERSYELILGKVGYKKGPGDKMYRRATMFTEEDGRHEFDGKIYYSVRGYRIFFETDVGTVQVWGEKTVKDDVYDLYAKTLKDVFWDEAETKKNSNYVYGICAYKDEYDQYIGDIQTLSVLKESSL